MHSDLIIVFGNLNTAIVDRFPHIARWTLNTAISTFVVAQVVMEGKILLASKVPN